MVSDPVTVPVHCDCGWTGFRVPHKVKARPCPNCDSEVKRWRALEKTIEARDEIRRRTLATMTENIQAKSRSRANPDTPLEVAIAKTFDPVPRLPNPYYLRTFTGEVQIYRIPAHCRRRGRPTRRR